METVHNILLILRDGNLQGTSSRSWFIWRQCKHQLHPVFSTYLHLISPDSPHGVACHRSPTICKIYQNKSAEGYSSLSYNLSLFSCLIWVYYAHLKPNSVLLISINAIGCIILTCYITIYLVFATRKDRVCGFLRLLLSFHFVYATADLVTWGGVADLYHPSIRRIEPGDLHRDPFPYSAVV